MDAPRSLSWRDILVSTILVLVITGVGCAAAFAVWLNDLYAPQIAILGSGNHLSLLVMDGPARLVIATGDDPIAFENAMTQVRPIFARRLDVLLAAGSGDTLLVPLAASGDAHVRAASAIAPLPPSPEREAFGAIATEPGPRRIKLGPALSVIVETRYAFGADPAESFPSWRVIVERGETRVVVLSDGEAAALFPPVNPASVLVVSGDDPVSGWPLSPAPVLVTNAGAISGPDLRSAFEQTRQPPNWGFRVFPGEALRLHFVADGIEIPSESAHSLR
jgi:hypothetical protein